MKTKSENKIDSQSSKRILSVYILSGFDMFWLIGGIGLALASCKITSSKHG